MRTINYIMISCTALFCGFCSCSSNHQINQAGDVVKLKSKFCDSIERYIIPTKYTNQAFYVSLHFADYEKDSEVYDFYLDSGIAITTIDSMLISKHSLPIKIGRKTTLSDLNGETVMAYEGLISRDNPVNLVVGNDTISIYECLITNGKNIFAMSCFPPDKIINVNVQNQYIALLDSLQYGSCEYSYLRDYFTNLPLIETTIVIEKNGVKIPLTGKFGLDLGIPAAMVLRSDFIDTYKDSVKFSEVLYLTPFENVFSSSIIFADATIEFQNKKSTHKIDFSRTFTSIRETSYIVGLLGHDFISNYDVAFDLAGKKIYITPLDTILQTQNQLYQKWGVSFDVVLDTVDRQHIDELVISLVLKDREGYAAGVFPGGVITEINRKPLNLNNTKALQQALDSCNSLTIQTTKGKIIHLD